MDYLAYLVLLLLICEQLAISHLTEKPVHSAYHRTAVYEHRYNCDHSPSFDNFSILCSDSNDVKLTVKKSLLINRDMPPLNKTITSLRLELFYHEISVIFT